MRKIYTRVRTWVVVFFLVVSFSVGCGSSPDKEVNGVATFHSGYPRSSFDFQGHRGARGLAPENTWPAFQTALSLGVDTLELDCHLTKDNVLIIHHDHSINPELCRYPDGREVPAKNVREWTLAELKELDCGSLRNKKFPEQKLFPGTRLITLDEFFRNVIAYEKENPSATKVNFNIETKIDEGKDSPEVVLEYVRNMTTVVVKNNMAERTTIQSFYLPVLPEVKKLDSRIKTSALFSPNYWTGFWMYTGIKSRAGRKIIQKAVEFQADIISPYYLYISNEFIKEARNHHLKVVPWTVNDRKKMVELMRYGVDGIITDYPNRFKMIITENK